MNLERIVDKDIATLDRFPGYKFHTDGYIIGKNEQKIDPMPDKNSMYKRTCLTDIDKKQRIVRIHRVIMEAFYGQASEEYEVDHINSNKLDNRLDNLRYIKIADHRRHTHNCNKGHNKKSAEKRAKIVIGYGPNKEIVEFKTITDANVFLGSKPKNGAISTCIKNNTLYKGWKFEYKDNNLPNEEWKKVVNYPKLEQDLFVSNLGRIRTKRVKTFGNEKEGYMKFSVKINGKNVNKSVHEFVCWAFNGDKPDWATSVNHIDCDTKNNKPENLEWSNSKLQAEHKILTKQLKMKLII